MFTTQGGVEIEQVAEENPDALIRLHVDPLEGFQPWSRAAADLRRRRRGPVRAEADRGDRREALPAFVEFDAMLCEINPLIVTPDGEVKALDSKFTVDDNALFRHPDIAEMRDTERADPIEAFAREKGVTYVKLDGDVGICGNGAGLSMSTVDVVAHRRRQAGELLRPRRRRQRAGRRRRARGDHARPAGEVDLLQHLRRHHALRRGRARHPRGARAARHVELPDRRPPRRHERRRGAARSSPMPASRTSTRGDDARGRPARSGARRVSSDVWSDRAEAYRDERDPLGRRGPRPRRRLVRARRRRRRRSTSRPAAAMSPGACGRRGRTS